MKLTGKLYYIFQLNLLEKNLIDGRAPTKL